MRRLPLLLGSRVLTAVGLALVAGGFVGWAARAREGIVFDAESKTFGALPVETKQIVPFRMTNRSARPVRIVGAEETCTPEGCIYAPKLPLEVAARETRELPIQIKTRSPGAFFRELRLFTDCPERPIVVLRVKGHVSDEKAP